MGQVVLVDQKDSFHRSPKSVCLKVLTHTLEPCFYRSVLLVHGFLCAECVVGKREKIDDTFPRHFVTTVLHSGINNTLI